MVPMTDESKDESPYAEEEKGKAEAPVEQASFHQPGWEFARMAAQSFLLPKTFPTQAELLYLPSVIPTIRVHQMALLKIFIIVSAIDLEVGWLGTAKRVGSDILVDEVFLFDQDVSYGHTELSTDSMSKVMLETLKRPDGESIFNNTRFWGHSHGYGGTSPSGQDDQTMRTFEGFGAQFFLRGIFNRTGDLSFSLYDWQNNLVYHRLPWKLVGKQPSMSTYLKLQDQLRSEMKERVVYHRPVILNPIQQGKPRQSVADFLLGRRRRRH
ncbi:MAG: hypothetical protein JWN50_383 [Parcubacteria group bacterium]|nr:hypothetical protein [Parcubacteria group bacterium]